VSTSYPFSLRRFVLCAFVFGVGSTSWAQPLAFPGAEGFGKYATGGRGGTVYFVTNLNDSGPGSFRDAVSVSGRTVIFRVGGVIDYQPPRYAPKANITIAGQTAPGDGITIYGNGLSFSGANNTICRFIRVRQGINGDSGTDCIGIANGSNMIFDHLSVSWGRDETFSVSGNITNITIQSSIISQGLQTHSAGGLIQANGGVSILRCLYIDNDTRNPKVKFKNEFVNNVIYNWDAFAYNMGGDSAGDSYVNAFNNYFINGPAFGASAFSGGNENFHIYATNNWQDSNLNGVLDGAMVPLANYGPMDAQASPYAYPITTAHDPLTAVKLAISDVGASWKRDSVDERMLTELTSYGTLGEFVNSEYEFPMNGPGTVRNGTPYPDADNDGMPDYWENGTGSNPALANNNDPSPGGGGHTRLEDYLNWLAEPHGLALVSQTCDIELRQFTRGFADHNPVYSITNVSNGIATLVDGGLRARFVPTPGYTGPAGFQFTVTDADGSTLTRKLNLFFTPAAQSFTPIWRGDDSTNNWNAGGDFNWFNGGSLLFPFTNGNSVLFDGTGSTNPFVNLVGTLEPALLTYDAANHYTFGGTGSLSGSMALNKTGTGTLTLSGTNTFTGATILSNGTALVNGSLPNSLVTVRSGATLGGRGSVGLPPGLQSGARLAPGGVGSPGTLTFSGNLTLPNAITLRFDLTDDPTGTVKTNDLVIVNGVLTTTGTNYIRVTLPDGPLNNGIYPLINYGSFSGSLANFVLVNANGVLTNLPGQIAILVNNVRYPAGLKWAGNGVNNNWDNGATTNWINGAAADVFYFFDSPIFDDSGATNPPVNLVGALTPQATTFNASKSYTLAGSGKITGYGPLIKTSSGTLTILTTNDYAGQTVLGEGVLSIGLLPNATVPSPIGIVEEDIDNLFFTGGTLRYTGGNTSTDRKLTLGLPGGTFDVTNAATVLTLNNAITGSGALIKTGAGRIDCAVGSSHTGGIIIRGGTMRLVSDSGFGSGIVTLNGTTNSATFLFGSDGQTLNNTISVSGTNNFIRLAGNDTVENLIGDGTLNIVTNSGTTFTMAGNMNGFSGILRATAIGNVRFNPSTGSGNALFDMGNNSVLLNNRNGGLTIQLGALSGGANVALQGASSANSLTTYVIGGRDMDTTFAGRISEVIPARTAAITKVGTGTFTLSGNNNTHTGATSVDGGTLLVCNTNGAGTGTNSVTVNDGGALGGTGFIFGPVIVNSGGALAPGSNTVGTLTVRSNLTINAGAMLNYELGTSNASDRVLVGGPLTLNGTLNITAKAGFGAGTYVLMNYSNTLSGPLPAVGIKPAGYSCTVSASAGQVRLLVAVQAPPAITGVLPIAGGIVLSGTGPTNGTFYQLSSTNVTLPLNLWAPVSTNVFDGAGNFMVTNWVVIGELQRFYRLQLP
jgi:autotransporter-associated beta strand protein